MFNRPPAHEISDSPGVMFKRPPAHEISDSPGDLGKRMAPARLPAMKIWKEWSGYHRRSLVETKMYCFKLIGQRVMARTFDRQITELKVRAAILNCCSQIGTPNTVRVA